MKKKYIAPTIITILISIVLIGWIAASIKLGIEINATSVYIALSIGVLLIILGLLVAAFISRIKEIKGGEEDDSSKY